MSVRRIVLLFTSLAAIGSARAQDPSTLPPAGNLPATINVYLDCDFCEFDFVRTEIPYVNWVRDRADADVHLLATRQSTGSGGAEYVFNLIGQRGFSTMVDTLKSVASVNATSDERRRAYTRTIKMGLVPFLARTALADRLNVSVAAASSSAPAPTPQRDPWHAWVFTTSANGFTFGEKTYHYYSGNLYTEAKRVTEKWKSSTGGEFRYTQSEQLAEGDPAQGIPDETFYNIQRTWSAYATQLKAIDQHLSAGVTGNIGASKFNNQDRYMKLKAALEYDVFPYSESTRREIRFQYGAGVAHYDYHETTVYLKDEETVPVHYASVAVSARQRWGDLDAQFEHNALIREPSKRNTELFAGGSFRVMKGLRFNIGGSYSWIHDQLYLPKGSASLQDVLLRQRALGTSYSYDFNVGMSYTFGSIFNNVVFPRFGGSSRF